MERRPLGRSGLKVGALSLGTMNFGSDWHGIGAVGEKTAARLLDAAFEAGVNLLDTADVYGRGAAETMLGRLLKKRRGRFLVATKVCGEMRPGDPSSGGLSRRHIAEALDDSLQRLKLDHVDLYMAHAPDPAVPLEESLEAFERARKAGKVRAVGVSNFSGQELEKCLRVSRVEFDQVQLSLAARFAEDDLAPVCLREEVGVMAWSPLGGGFLTGKRGEGRRKAPGAFPSLPENRLQGLLKVLAGVARLEGITSAQAALGWALSKPWLSTAVVGARTPEQLRETLASRPLPDKSAELLDRASRL